MFYVGQLCAFDEGDDTIPAIITAKDKDTYSILTIEKNSIKEDYISSDDLFYITDESEGTLYKTVVNHGDYCTFSLVGEIDIKKINKKELVTYLKTIKDSL
jgi:hypothetical protein